MTVDAQGNSHEIARQGEFVVSTDPSQLDVSLIHEFLSQRSYWAAGIPLEAVRKSIDNSLCFGLYQQGSQIGFARMVTDRATFAYLADVFVLESARGQGLSKWLLECILRHPDLQGLRRILLGTLDAHGLYRQFGFTPVATPERFMELFCPEIYQAKTDG
jgi:GNAT superfamily N-acetyltransferase